MAKSRKREGLVSRKQAAKMLLVGPSGIDWLIKRGEVKTQRIGKRLLLVTAESIAKYNSEMEALERGNHANQEADRQQ